MGMVPEAVFFDFDGVIANSDAFNLAGLSAAADSIDIPFTSRDFASYFSGRRLRDGATAYLQVHGKTDFLDDFLEAKYSLDPQYLDYCVPYPVAAALVKQLCTQKYRLCLVSGSRRALLERFLDRYDMANCFDSVVSGEDVVRGKPSPDPYVLGLSRLSICEPAKSLAIEDSPAGVAAAQGASLPCLAVCHTHTASLLRDADAVLPSIAHVARDHKNTGVFPVDVRTGIAEDHDAGHDSKATTHQVEVLQVSSLEDFSWPASDPHDVHQPTRTQCDSDIELVRECAQAVSVNVAQIQKNARRECWDLPHQIMRVLAHQKFQMNPSKAVREESTWLRAVADAVRADRPIEIVYPQFCVIPNAPKRYTNVGPAAGEDCTIEFVKYVNEHVKQIYKPGIRLHALADASLYASAFQTHQTEVDAYYSMLAGRVEALGATDCFELHDYARLLRTQCNPEYQILYYEIGQKVWAGEPESLLPNTDISTLRRSVRCSINTRRFQLSHKEHLSLFGPMEYRDYGHGLLPTLEQMTDIALREVITVRLACGEIDIATRLWPQALRATCHKGPKNGRWPIGLKTYPEYYGSCKLLPYHGMPVINSNSKGKPKLTIEPEVKLRSRSDLVRVMSTGDDVYVYIDKTIHDQRFGELSTESKSGMRCSEME